MPITSLTKMVCDQKGCNKTFLVDETPGAKLPPGTDEIIRVIDAKGSQLVFCSGRHEIAYRMAYLKATPAPEPKGGIPRRVPSKTEIDSLKAAGLVESRAGAAVEELETLSPAAVPPPPESLKLEDEVF